MKAYVFKNKEGKYKEPHLDILEFYTGSIIDAEMWSYKEIAEYCCPNNCEVVEITIAEGNLERQLAEKDKEIATLKVGLNCSNQWNKELYERKEKEIEELRDELEKCSNNQWYIDLDRLKEQLKDNEDFKNAYYHDLEEAKKELKIYKKALELACYDIAIDRCDGDYDIKGQDFELVYLDKAKESIDDK